MNAIPNIATIPATIELTDITSTIKGTYAEELHDYSGNTYICDAISEIADSRTSIYYSDILDFIRKNPEALADVVEEGLYYVDSRHPYDLYKHGQAAEFMTIEREIYDNLDDAIKAYAANYIREAYHAESIPADIWESIENDLDDIDNNSQFDDITDIVDQHMQPDDEEETED